MNFENRPTHSLRPYAGNARTHSPRQIKQIARSIERFGFNNPVLVDDDDQIIAGHGRVEGLYIRQARKCNDCSANRGKADTSREAHSYSVGHIGFRREESEPTVSNY
jgi:hypothetical protein